MEAIQNHILSIKDLISYFKSCKEYLFYVGRIYCVSPLDLYDRYPRFEIITCFDPFNQQFPFIKVPNSIKNAESPHKCINATECQAAILQDPQVIAYMKAKSARPNVFYMMINEQCEKLCQQNELTFWGAPNQTYKLLGNKVKIIQLLKNNNIPYIPNICSRIRSYEHFLQLSKFLNSQKIVAQSENGVSGIGTYFIFNKQDYDKHSQALQSQLQFKIMPYKHLKSFGISAVTGSFGTVIGPIHAEVIGHHKLTPFRGGFCANQQRNDYFEDLQVEKRIRKEMFDITKCFGDYLYKEGIFRGMFGIDFVVDIESHVVYFMEINPRLTGSTTVSYQLYEAQGQQFPIILFHCLEFMGINIKLDIQSFNRQWLKLTHYDPPGTHIAIKPFNDHQRNLRIKALPGLWMIQQGQLKFSGKFSYKLKQMKEGQFFFMQNHGFSKGNIMMKRKCQDYSCNLTPDVSIQSIRFSNQLPHVYDYRPLFILHSFNYSQSSLASILILLQHKYIYLNIKQLSYIVDISKGSSKP